MRQVRALHPCRWCHMRGCPYPCSMDAHILWRKSQRHIRDFSWGTGLWRSFTVCSQQAGDPEEPVGMCKANPVSSGGRSGDPLLQTCARPVPFLVFSLCTNLGWCPLRRPGYSAFFSFYSNANLIWKPLEDTPRYKLHQVFRYQWSRFHGKLAVTVDQCYETLIWNKSIFSRRGGSYLTL